MSLSWKLLRSWVIRPLPSKLFFGSLVMRGRGLWSKFLHWRHGLNLRRQNTDELRRATYDAKKGLADSYLDVLISLKDKWERKKAAADCEIRLKEFMANTELIKEIMNNYLLASDDLTRLRAKEVELGIELDVAAVSDFFVWNLDLPQIFEDLSEEKNLVKFWTAMMIATRMASSNSFVLFCVFFFLLSFCLVSNNGPLAFDYAGFGFVFDDFPFFEIVDRFRIIPSR